MTGLRSTISLVAASDPPPLPGPAHTPPARAWAEIDLDRLRRNLAAVRRLVPDGVPVYGAVPADAFGHGAVLVAGALQRFGIDGLVVGGVDEGCALRRAGIAVPILVLDPALSDQASHLVAAGLTATVTSLDEASCLAEAARTAGRAVAVHVRVGTGADDGTADSGAPADAVVGLLTALTRLDGLRVEGLYAHLPGLYRGSDAAAAAEFGRFDDAVSRAAGAGLRPPLVHALASPGLTAGNLVMETGRMACTMVRTGSLLYGLGARGGTVPPAPFEPILEVKARVVRVAGTSAVVPFGTADGPHLTAGPNVEVLIRGRRVPMIGDAALNGMLVDVSALPDVAPGDEAVLIGVQDGQRIGVEAVAARCGRPPSCVLTLGPRVARIPVRETVAHSDAVIDLTAASARLPMAHCRVEIG